MPEPETERDKINKVAADLSAKAAVLVADGLIEAAEKGEVTETELPHAYLITGIYSITNSIGGFLQCVLNRPLTVEERKDILGAVHGECSPMIRRIIEKYVPSVADPSKTA